MDTITNTYRYKRAYSKPHKAATAKDNIFKTIIISNKEKKGNMTYNDKRLQNGIDGLNLSDQPQCGIEKPWIEAGKPNRGCGLKRWHQFDGKCAANAEGTDSEAVNVCQMRRRKLRQMMRQMMKAAHSDDNFHGFPGMLTKQQCKRKHKHEVNEGGNANEDNNSSTENQAEGPDEENEKNARRKSAEKGRKQLRQAVAMNSYMHPAFLPPFVMNSMPEAGQKQMMRKWLKTMHKCKKQDAESTEKSASSDEKENDVHVETEASKDCKTEDQQKTERQQRRQMRTRAMAFGAGLEAGSVYPGMAMNENGTTNNMNVWKHSFQGFPGMLTKQQWKRKHKHESNASGNANEDKNSSTENQAEGPDEENEKNERKKSAEKWRKQLRQTAAMNSYMHPAFRPPCVVNYMSEAGRKQMMRKWWKQMQKWEKPDAESTEKSASSDEKENDVHVETEASKVCKTGDQQKTERQQRRQMRRRAMALFGTGIVAPDHSSIGPPFVGPPPEFVRAFIKKRMLKNKKMKDNGEESKEESSCDEIIVADCCESMPENYSFGANPEQSIQQEGSETYLENKRKSERPKCSHREMKRAMALNTYMLQGFTGGMYGPPTGYIYGWRTTVRPSTFVCTEVDATTSVATTEEKSQAS